MGEGGQMPPYDMNIQSIVEEEGESLIDLDDD